MRLTCSGELIVDAIGDASTFWKRLRGWFHPEFRYCRGVMLYPCRSIHTWFMQEKIDVIFISSNKHVCKILECLAKNRFAYCQDATYVLELPAGMAGRHGFYLGQVLEFKR